MEEDCSDLLTLQPSDDDALGSIKIEVETCISMQVMINLQIQELLPKGLTVVAMPFAFCVSLLSLMVSIFNLFLSQINEARS